MIFLKLTGSLSSAKEQASFGTCKLLGRGGGGVNGVNRLATKG